MLSHDIVHKAEVGSQESRSWPACKEDKFAAFDLPLSQTPAPASAPRSPPLPPARSPSAGGRRRRCAGSARTLTLAASDTSRGFRNREAVRGAQRPASCRGCSAGARPRHTFPIPSWAGARRPGHVGPPAARCAPFGLSLEKNFCAGDGLSVSMQPV
uniref:Uncharacterized protein n=1 Tax=Mustela putorius furo TaxID=9669 RepID=M3YPB8_MUSPF